MPATETRTRTVGRLAMYNGGAKKQASKVVASLGFTDYNVRSPSFLVRSLARSLSLSSSRPLTHSYTLSPSLSLCYARALSLVRSFPYLYLARSHLFVAGLGMLSWDSAAGSSEGTLPGPRPYGGHSRAQHHLVHNVAGSSRAPIRDWRPRPSHPETRTNNPVVRARLLSSTADLRLRGDARAFSPRSPSLSSSHSVRITRLSPSLFSRNCRHGTSYEHIGRLAARTTAASFLPRAKRSTRSRHAHDNVVRKRLAHSVAR